MENSERTTTTALEMILNHQRTDYLKVGAPNYHDRIDHLSRLEKALIRHADDIVNAVIEDFGSRSPLETRMSEILQTLGNLQYTKKRMRRWMKPRRGHVAWTFQPSKAKVFFQPLGVVGIISPWNYPVSLTLIPLIAALAAGNRVMVKPSEITPKTSDAIKKMLGEIFPEKQVAVCTGGPTVGQAFSALAFDHLLFTGSTALGRRVMGAAAQNLTPVTLELGGKSPAIVQREYPIKHAAERIAAGKFFNAGQTCTAPDYVLVHREKLTEFTDTIQSAIRRMYPTTEDRSDYTAIVNDRHYQRLNAYLEDAKKRGADVVQVVENKAGMAPTTNKLPPTLVLGADDSMLVLQEEIFGPILIILAYDLLEDAIAFVNNRPRPLALYYFDRNPENISKLVAHTTSGGVCVNDTLFHGAQEDLPFGGVGESGMGAYHGKEGFETFSHKKSVFYQSRFVPTGIWTPPYNSWTHRLVNFLIGRH